MARPHDLPIELWFEIMRDIKAKEIISICSTCKAFHALLSERTVWTQILRFVCREDGVHLSSYDVGNMDINQLRHAAMGRNRWGRLLEENCLQLPAGKQAPSNPPVLKPASGPIILPSAMTDGLGEMGYGYRRRALDLIPGGRYVVLADLRSLKLLDLGVSGKPPLPTPLEVAKVQFGPFRERVYGLRLLSWQHESGSIGVAVGMQYDTAFTVAVYTVSPSGLKPDFKALGSVQLAPETFSLWQIRVHHGLIHVGADVAGGGIVWDFEKGLYTRVPLFQPEIRFCVFTGDFIAQFTSTELLLWSVPSLNLEVPHDGQIPISPIMEDISKDMIFLHPFYSLRASTRVDLCAPCYQPHISFPITVEATIPPRKGEGHFNLSRYSVTVVPRPKLETPGGQSVDVAFTLEAYCAIPSHFYPLSPHDHRSAFDIGYPSRDLRFRGSWHSPLCVLSVVNPHNLEPSRLTGKHAALTDLHLNLDEPIDYGILCSSSGRLVGLQQIKGAAVSVFVVDYLSS